MERYYRYVLHERIEAFRACGWYIAQADLGHHSHYAVLMRWPFDDKPPVDPPLPEKAPDASPEAER
jgi:hypothetical protein